MISCKSLVGLLWLAVLAATSDLSPVSRYYLDDGMNLYLYGYAQCYDGAIKLDGSDGTYAHVASGMSANAASFSVSGWVRFISGQGFVVTMYDDLKIESVSGLAYRLRFGTPAAGEDEQLFPLMTKDECLGWTHVVFTVENGNVQMYVNGSSYGPQLSRPQALMTEFIGIGSGDTGLDGPAMEMEEFLVFDFAVTASDVFQLYQTGFSGQYFAVYVLVSEERCYLDYDWLSVTGEDFGLYIPDDERNLVFICDEDKSDERLWRVIRKAEDDTINMDAYFGEKFCIKEYDGHLGEGFEVSDEQYNLKCDRSDPYYWYPDLFQLESQGGIAYYVYSDDQNHPCVWTHSDNRKQYEKNDLIKYGYEAVCVQSTLAEAKASDSAAKVYLDGVGDTSEDLSS